MEQDPRPLLALVAALVLAAIHVQASRLVRFPVVPRSRILSVGSGISVAYVFVHLLPELGEWQRELAERATQVLPFLERHVWVMALAGLAVMYGLEHSVRRREASRTDDDSADDPTNANTIGWIHLGSYGLYNAVVGALLLERSREGFDALIWFAAAMAVHFLVTDHALAESHGRLYRRWGRWTVGMGTLVGWATAALGSIPTGTLAIMTALLGGGVILNVLKEELPEDREASFPAFAVGAAAYTALLLAA